MRKYLFYGFLGILSGIITFPIFTEIWYIRVNDYETLFSVTIGSVIFIALILLDPLRKYFKKFKDEKEKEKK